MKSVQTIIIAGFLLSMLLLPHLALADVPNHSIELSPLSGVYRDQIGAWITVPEPGTYYICWEYPLRIHARAEIRAFPAGDHSVYFTVPKEAKRGLHAIHLILADEQELASANFTVYPTVEIHPKKGSVDTEVEVKGYGFSENETGIPVKFRDTQIKVATADDKGSWAVSYAISNLPAGIYMFEVGPDSEMELVEWRMQFTVTPKISVSPVSGVAGQVIDVSGTGFARNEKGIRVIFDDEIAEEDISADANGSWSAKIAVPRRGSGTYIIDASGRSTWSRDVPDVTFTIETGVSVAPASAQVGDEITVTGSGFAAWEEGIKVTFDDRVLDTGTIAVDRHGSWEASFVLPTSTYGPHTVVAYGDITEAADVKQATLNTMAKIEVTPVEGSPGDSVTLAGSGFPSRQALTVTFANRPVRDSVDSRANGSVSAIVTVPASPVGKLAVTASGGSAEASADFTVIAGVLPTPQPISPEEGKTLRSREITFEWGRITGSNITITYTLEIQGPGGSQRISDIEALSYQIPKDEALPKGDYSWRVKAIDEFGNESGWSNPIPFTVSPIPTFVWVIVGLVVLTTLMVVAYREGKFKVIE